ncbi:alpha/beta fold hydrolase [Nocardia cerradoensis]|uniref:2-hydroxymuconate semialdehyde hydrolase n=1 Tax=Nocardia cerradoensis TaxID=85688 RepID=A0A231H0U3_9NOCA|nr:alpha/beta hydrolase [Nocardia cerradoensis]NKY42990.1 alpha/beta hydrolase [Nocardia cerradoensis]OXR42462.1 2-hydroxymuconate semialdehyde hydrolase [Nocardia cerradoensis]
MTYLSDQAEDRFVDGPEGERFHYRRFGRPSTVPLVLCMRLRGTVDHWDPALLDALAAEREVIVFDNRGTNASTGSAPTTIDGLADGGIAFLRALGLEQADVLGWSLGGIVAQGIALRAPELVRRLIVAGSTPAGVPNQPPPPARVGEILTHAVNDDEDYLYLFFPDTDHGRSAGLKSLRRLDSRLGRSKAAVGDDTYRKQLAAIAAFGGYYERLTELTLPVLVANGAQDVMINAYASFAMSQRLADAKVVLYSDAGHGFLFQHIEDFAHEVDRFLS